MNYLAHGFRFLDDPIFLAGTAVPDWLRVADSTVRARAQLVHPVVESTNDDQIRRLGRGILQHHADDDAFHANPIFQKIGSHLSARFRQQMPDRYDHRPGFLAHVLTELLLDDALASQDPALLDRYYGAIEAVPSCWIQQAVNLIVRQPVTRLAEFIDLFRQVRFLYDYADNNRLLMRINQVLSRSGLQPLDTCVVPIFDDARSVVRSHTRELLETVSPP